MLPSKPVGLSSVMDASNSPEELLDNSVYQFDGNVRARYFWYGIAALIGVTAILNLRWRLDLRLRYAFSFTGIASIACAYRKGIPGSAQNQQAIVLPVSFFRLLMLPQTWHVGQHIFK
jgi:hypothetical protein